ncbi:MAG: hypothetical protein JW395_3006 [Nitrospira sp.]|nr:hypothetical protein [Nitrospira sp.]
MNIAFHIADRSITFFAKGRPWVVAEDGDNFVAIRKGLLSIPQMDREELVKLADPVIALREASNGKINVEFDQVFYNGEVMHNVWVEKLLGLKSQGLPFDPLMKALESLQRNPTAAARERLPIFVEQSMLGILPDGRVAAMKVVRSDYMDCHSGSFDNAPGRIVEQPRDNCDPDPDNECSSGLHLGAYAYLPNYGMNQSDRRVMLCAFWPEDVVAVRKDYSGQKMRVTRYEVLEELEKSSLPGFIEENKFMMQDYELAEVDDEDDFENNEDHFANDAEYEPIYPELPTGTIIPITTPDPAITLDQVGQMIADALAAAKPKPRKRRAPAKKTKQVLRRKTPVKKKAIKRKR